MARSRDGGRAGRTAATVLGGEREAWRIMEEWETIQREQVSNMPEISSHDQPLIPESLTLVVCQLVPAFVE